MNVPPKLRIPLIALLTIIGILALLSGFRYGSILLLVSNLNKPYLLLGCAGGFAMLLFVIAVTRALLRKQRISKESYIISIVFSVISLIILVFFGYGFLKDILGEHCSGFFGTTASCTLTPLLLLAVYALHPVALGIAGAISTYGIITLRNLNKKTVKKS